MAYLLDENGAYFIDRDGDTFAVILSWLRTGEIPQMENEEARIVITEAKYFQLDGLSSALEQKLLLMVWWKFKLPTLRHKLPGLTWQQSPTDA